jgi:hypothetical protein
MVIDPAPQGNVVPINYTDERYRFMLNRYHGLRLPTVMWPTDGELSGRYEYGYSNSQ